MIRINLIPEAVQASQARSFHIRRWMVVLAVVGSVLMISVGVDWLHHAEADELNGELDQVHTELALARERLKSVIAESQQVIGRIQRADALRSKRPWSGLLVLIGSCMPADCWLTSIATDPPPTQAVGAKQPTGRAKTPVSPGSAARGNPARQPPQSPGNDCTVVLDAPRKLRVIGYAINAGQPHVFVAALKNTGVFKGVTLEGAQSEPVLDGSYFRFELLCEW